MALPYETGWIGKACPECRTGILHAEVTRSMAGYYVGTFCSNRPCRDSEPASFSRESGYFATHELAAAALASGEVRR